MRAVFGAVKRLCDYAHTSRRFFWSAALVSLLVTVFFLGWIQFRIGGQLLTTSLDDIGEAVAAYLAAVACTVAACRNRGRARSGWGLMALSAAAWATGETAWSVYEVGLGISVPFPSLADTGFLILEALVLVVALDAVRGHDFQGEVGSALEKAPPHKVKPGRAHEGDIRLRAIAVVEAEGRTGAEDLAEFPIFGEEFEQSHQPHEQPVRREVIR